MKKFIALLLTVVLTATVAVSGTLAWLNDTDSDVNVMTVGKVDIEQLEKQRADISVASKDTAANLIDFVDSKMLPAVWTGTEDPDNQQVWMPGGGSGALEDSWVNYGNLVNADITGSHWTGVWGTSLKNVKDKMVFVSNKGNESVYYRTIILYEHDDLNRVNSYGQEFFHMNVNGNARFTWTDTPITVEIDGEKYDAIVATYNIPLLPNTTSRPSLIQVGFDAEADNEYMTQFGEKFEIYCLSQAVQVEGFGTPAEGVISDPTYANKALNAEFGEVNATNLAAWFANIVDAQ